MSIPKLVYFDAPIWRVEVARVCFHLGGVPFEDVRMTREEFAKKKAEGEFPFGQVPVLYVKDRWMTQAVAIMKYAAKQANLYPSNDFDAGKVDELINLCQDMLLAVIPSFLEKDPEVKKTMRKKLNDVDIPLFCDRVTKLIETNKSGPYLLGELLTVADISLYYIFFWIQSGTLDDIDADIIKKYPKLEANVKAFNDNKLFKEWKAKFPDAYKSK